MPATSNAKAKSPPRKKSAPKNPLLKEHLKRMRAPSDEGAARKRALRIARDNLASITPEEDAAITAAAVSDPDAVPMTDEEFARARPGRPPAAAGAKKPISVRLDPDVLDALRAGGPGWQTRMNGLLRQALKLDAA